MTGCFKVIRLLNSVWRYYNMRQQAMGFLKGMGAGILAGVAVAAIGSHMMQDNRGFRRRADKTMRGIGDILDSVQALFR